MGEFADVEAMRGDGAGPSPNAHIAIDDSRWLLLVLAYPSYTDQKFDDHFTLLLRSHQQRPRPFVIAQSGAVHGDDRKSSVRVLCLGTTWGVAPGESFRVTLGAPDRDPTQDEAALLDVQRTTGGMLPEDTSEPMVLQKLFAVSKSSQSGRPLSGLWQFEHTGSCTNFLKAPQPLRY